MDNDSIIRELVALWEREYPRQSTKKIHKFDWEIKDIEIKDIKTFMPRKLSKAKKYMELKQNGIEFPPIVVIRQKKNPNRYILIDGFHRMWAYKKLGVGTVTAYIGTKKGQPEIFSKEGLYNL
ncbi:MAG: ParB/RepB/Spo0J family partition protein [Deltaproteobacteria bacterium]